MYSKKSALPQTPETDLLPCLATLALAADATIAAAVLILNDFIKSPPVPQISTSRPFTLGVILTACLLKERRTDLSSSAVSPAIARATRKAAIDESGVTPLRIPSSASEISSDDNSVLATSFFMADCNLVDTLIFSP